MTVNPDLLRERQGAEFDPKQLSCLLYGGPEAYRRKKYIENLAASDPFLKTIPSSCQLSREEHFENGVKYGSYIHEKLRKLNITDPRERFYFRSVVMPSNGAPFGLHESMFTQTLEGQSTDEQQERWLPMARNLEMVGTYGQTELGHGTNVRSLETTATYDPRRQEFIINSPTLTSTKWWPGHLGKVTNHSIVMAQLYTEGKCYGVHPFLVQTRSLVDHQPLKGVKIGDIGQKFGYGNVDNGFLSFDHIRIPRENMLMRYSEVKSIKLGDIGQKFGSGSIDNGFSSFDHVRIPRENMLMKYTEVTPDGKYNSKTKRSRELSYFTMLAIRSFIALGCSGTMAKASTIAIRYSAVRRQGYDASGTKELQVLDYQTQQYKLFPVLAAAFAFHFSGHYMRDFYMDIKDKISQGQLDELAQLHALSSCLKAFTSWECKDGMETCRLSCGGHGYMNASGFPYLYGQEVPNCTFEGENTVLMLQTARFLMKCANQVQQGEQLPGFLSYMNAQRGGNSRMASITVESLAEAYKHRAARLISVAALKIKRLVSSGADATEAWNKTTVQLVKAAGAHCHAFIVHVFLDTIKSEDIVPEIKVILTQQYLLYALYGISEYLGDFIQDGYISSGLQEKINEKLYDTLRLIRPNAVAIVDAFDFADTTLDSALGAYDGDVYERLYKSALTSKLNATEVHPSYYKYLQPLYHAAAGSSPSAVSKL